MRWRVVLMVVVKEEGGDGEAIGLGSSHRVGCSCSSRLEFSQR
jgi:hypothetical protein